MLFLESHLAPIELIMTRLTAGLGGRWKGPWFLVRRGARNLRAGEGPWKHPGLPQRGHTLPEVTVAPEVGVGRAWYSEMTEVWGHSCPQRGDSESKTSNSSPDPKIVRLGALRPMKGAFRICFPT